MELFLHIFWSTCPIIKLNKQEVAFLFEFVVEMQDGAIRLDLGVHKHWLHDMKMLCNGVKLQGNAIAKWSNELEA